MNCICEDNHCTSCLACYERCARGAIKSGIGHNGFPSVDISCDGLCNKCSFSCPQITPISKYETPHAYAVQIKDKNDLIKSTSGGMFSLLSKYVFENKGVVFGAIYDNKLRVHHGMAENFSQIEEMRGSKYVLSDITNTYKKIKSILESGRIVLFVGLPCQVAGVYAFLGEKPKKLITADLVCSGVPSQFLFDQYIKYIERRKKIHIIDYKFRDKRKYGVSHTSVIKYKTRSGKIKEKTIPDRRKISYYVAFGKQNCFMDACYDCNYNTIQRISDFTLGGFWNIGNCNSVLNEHDGVSLVLASTEKAEAILTWGKRIAYIEHHDLSLSIKNNIAINTKNSSENLSKDIYYSMLSKGYRKTSNTYFKSRTIIGSMVSKIKRLLMGKKPHIAQGMGSKSNLT